MKKRITESQLRKLVEQKVDEAWYNNMDDFYRGVGKATTIGALTAGSVLGGGYAIDKGLESNDRYRQNIQQQVANQPSEVDYIEWCKQHNLDPNNDHSLAQYNDCFNSVDESQIRYMVRRAIVENMVRNELKRQLTESNLSTNNVDCSDLRVFVEPYNEDGYCEWEATCDNGWYSFRGTYSNGECELDDVIEGHSGYGHQHDVDDELRNWFYENLYDRVCAKIESKLA